MLDGELQGQGVRYPDGYPDFKEAGMVKQEVDIGSFTNRAADNRTADASAPNGPIGENSTWHHHQDGKTLQEVDRSTHREFTHRGGISLTK